MLIIGVFIVENILIALRFLIAGLIPDNPEWIEKEALNMENRVKQIKGIIDEKVIMAKIIPDIEHQKKG